tara:strand:- start:375 stop:755 length:381 start_codon:yes stop_codon:yes gene_type:complete
LITLLSGLTNLASTFINNQKAKSVAKSKLAIKKIEAETEVQKRIIQGDIDWETTQARNSNESIKDELYTIFFIGIMLACFIPDLQPYIKQGFIFLKEDCPTWLSTGILISISASFGIKGIKNFRGN